MKQVSTELIAAAKSGSLPGVVQSLEEKADINGGENQETALHWASHGNHIAIVVYLIQQGANVNITTKKEMQTPLMWASIKGNIGVIHWLVKSGANIHQADVKRYQPIHYAVQNDQIFLVEYFFEQGVSVEVRDGGNHTLLMWATNLKNTHIIRHLLTHGADVSAVDNKGWTALHWAAQKGHLDAASILIKSGSDVRQRTFLMLQLYPPLETQPESSPIASDSHSGGMTALEIAHTHHRNHLVGILRTNQRAPYFFIRIPWQYRSFATFLTGCLTILLTFAIFLFSPHILLSLVITVFLVGMMVTFMNYLQLGIFVSAYGVSAIYWIFNFYDVSSSISLCYVLFQFLFLGLYYHLCTGDPGLLKGTPQTITQIVNTLVATDSGTNPSEINNHPSLKKLCMTCKISKTIRSKHCRQSNVCIARFDHYCTWTANAVGFKNHRQFFILLFLAMLNHFSYADYGITYMINNFQTTWYNWPLYYSQASPQVLLIGFHLINFVWLGHLYLYQLSNILFNLTTNEDMNRKRYHYLLRKNKDRVEFFNPFHIGILNNFKQFWFHDVNWYNYNYVPTKESIHNGKTHSHHVCHV